MTNNDILKEQLDWLFATSSGGPDFADNMFAICDPDHYENASPEFLKTLDSIYDLTEAICESPITLESLEEFKTKVLALA